MQGKVWISEWTCRASYVILLLYTLIQFKEDIITLMAFLTAPHPVCPRFCLASVLQTPAARQLLFCKIKTYSVGPQKISSAWVAACKPFVLQMCLHKDSTSAGWPWWISLARPLPILSYSSLALAQDVLQDFSCRPSQPYPLPGLGDIIHLIRFPQIGRWRFIMCLIDQLINGTLHFGTFVQKVHGLPRNICAFQGWSLMFRVVHSHNLRVVKLNRLHFKHRPIPSRVIIPLTKSWFTRTLIHLNLLGLCPVIRPWLQRPPKDVAMLSWLQCFPLTLRHRLCIIGKEPVVIKVLVFLHTLAM